MAHHLSEALSIFCTLFGLNTNKVTHKIHRDDNNDCMVSSGAIEVQFSVAVEVGKVEVMFLLFVQRVGSDLRGTECARSDFCLQLTSTRALPKGELR